MKKVGGIVAIAILLLALVGCGKDTTYGGVDVGDKGLSKIMSYQSKSDKFARAIDGYLEDGKSDNTLVEPMSKWLQATPDTQGLDPDYVGDIFDLDGTDTVIDPNSAQMMLNVNDGAAASLSKKYGGKNQKKLYKAILNKSKLYKKLSKYTKIDE